MKELSFVPIYHHYDEELMCWVPNYDIEGVSDIPAERSEAYKLEMAALNNEDASMVDDWLE